MRHTLAEDRLIAVGRNPGGRPLFVASTLRTRRGQTLIRPVGARYTHAKEVAADEKGAQAPDR